MLPLDAYEQMRRPPATPPVMYQRWRSLLFLHYSCDVDAIRPLVPPELEIDTFDGKAWIGLVPFRMEGVRARFTIGVPGNTAFPETNVRTYVHHEGRAPGVWFFSLDAASALACRAARIFYALPYYESEMSVLEEAGRVEYASERRHSHVKSHVTTRIGADLGTAQPGSLEYFLIERYLLYARRFDRLFTCRVSHEPYPLTRADEVVAIDELVPAAGLPIKPFEHRVFSAGVDVKVYPLLPA